MSTFPDCTGSDTLFSTPVMEYKDRGNYSNDKEMTSNAYTNDTMTNDNPFLDMKQDDSGNSLSLDIRNTQFSSNGNTSVSASTTLNTTAATNTPATNVNSLPSPDFNSYSQFDSPEVLNSSSMNFKLGNGGGGSDPLQQQQQNSAFENSSLSTASSGTKLNNGSRNYDYYKVNNKSNIGSNHQRISHTHTLSTPTAMNDFIAMLDAQSAIQQQVRPRQQDEQTLGHSSYQYESNSDLSFNEFTITASKNQEDNDSLSPLRNSSAQFIDPNLLKSNMFIDTLGLSQSNDDQALNNGSGDENIFQQSSLSSLLDDYVSTDLLVDDPTSMNNSTKLAHMHSNPDKNLFSNDRRHSEVITKAVPEITDSRGSISHSIDFWNLPDGRNTINECLTGKNIDQKEAAMPTSSFNMDNELTQVLNEYNMNFTRSSRRGSHGANPTYISNSNGPPSQRHGIKKQQRGSMSVLDGSLNGDLFSKLYKNGHRSSNLKVVSWENAVLSDDDDEYGRRSIDASLPNLEPIISPKSPKSVGASKQQKNQFIKPSMMLSDNASAAAKVATTGAEKIDLISGVERRSYDISMNSSMKIKRSPPPHYQTIKPCPVGSVNPSMSAPAAATRRRRSTPNIMTIRNATSGATFNGGGKSKSRSITPMSGADDEAKPFKCKECSKAFRRSEHLKRHIRSVHSSERPFACMFCEKKFSRSDNLSQHLKTHKKHGDF